MEMENPFKSLCLLFTSKQFCRWNHFNSTHQRNAENERKLSDRFLVEFHEKIYYFFHRTSGTSIPSMERLTKRSLMFLNFFPEKAKLGGRNMQTFSSKPRILISLYRFFGIENCGKYFDEKSVMHVRLRCANERWRWFCPTSL